MDTGITATVYSNFEPIYILRKETVHLKLTHLTHMVTCTNVTFAITTVYTALSVARNFWDALHQIRLPH